MRSFSTRLVLMVAAIVWLNAATGAQAYVRQFWQVTSPTHAQTFAYGSEQLRQWVQRGNDRHLALMLNYTNDPYVDRNNPRQYDYFTFHFPTITLGADGKTFFYQAPDKRKIPVAVKHSVFLGTDIKLLPNCELIIKKPHGTLTVSITVQDMKAERQDGF